MKIQIALKINLLLAVLSLCGLVKAQEINLSGTVLDIKSGVPLNGVEVSLTAHHLRDTTDEQGKFMIVRSVKGISAGKSEDGVGKTPHANPSISEYTFGPDTTVKDTLYLSKPGYLNVGKPLNTLEEDNLVIELGKHNEFEGGWAKVPGILAAITPPSFPTEIFSLMNTGQ